MPKAKHSKRVRTARQNAANAPLGGASVQPAENGEGSKKVGKKEAEVTSILDKLRSADAKERIQGSSALSSMLLNLPPVTLRLLLAKNLIGLLIERLTDTEDEVIVECLGALRNLAVSSPLSLLSEVHNKRLLLPLTSTIIPKLGSHLPTMLRPESLAQNGSSSQQDRQQLQERRRLYWDWSENVLTLIWCLAESNTKILASLNAQPAIVEFCAAFLSSAALGLAPAGSKGKKKQSGKVVRVPPYVAVAASQALLALLSSNATAQRGVPQETVQSLQALLSVATADKSGSGSEIGKETSDAEEWDQLRVIAFGILLELSKGQKRFRHVQEDLKPHASILLNSLSFDLAKCVEELEALSQEDDPTQLADTNKMASHERRLSTLQSSLEVLSEYFTSLDTLSANAFGEEDEEEEEWTGIVDHDGDADMDADDDDANEEVILQRPRPEDEDDGMMEDEQPAVALEDEDLDTLASLPAKLIKLARPTKLSFLPPQTTVVSNSSTLMPTSSETIQAIVPASLLSATDMITLIHVRALECANNLFITLAKSSSATEESEALWRKDWQAVFETTLNLVREAASSVSSEVGPERNGSDRKDEMREDEERKLEFVGAGTGVVWGLTRLGLNRPDDGEDVLDVVPAVSSFLLELFNHPFAKLLTPAGETIRVRIVGALGSLGRRQAVTAEENAMIGDALLAILPQGKEASSLTPTIEVLIQTVDSFIDLYADEESPYDSAVFRQRQYLPQVESAVSGLRAACKRIDKKRFPALRNRADGALENLVAFAQYRRDLRL